MESLPTEIIQYILADSSLNIIDIVRFSSTCTKLRELVTFNRSLWKTKYFQRWPKTDFEVVCEDWYNECIFRIHFEKQAQELLSSMSSRFFHLDRKKIGSSQIDFILCLLNSHICGYYYLRDYLAAINSLPLTKSLTNKYYGNILMKHIHKKHNRAIWNDLLLLSTEEQTLEKGAIFVAAWCQEYERGLWKKIMFELDNIASKRHPLKHTPEEIQSAWRSKNIPGNVFGPEDCESVIWAMNHVLFEDLKYCISYDFNELDKKKSRIDFALLDRNANPYIFAIIYESVARRLGVKVEIFELPDECFIRWKVDYGSMSSRCYYIRPSNNRVLTTFLSPQKPFTDELIAPCNMLKIAQKAAFYVHSRELGESHFSLIDTLELQLVIKPFSLEYYQQLSQTHILHELDSRELISKIKNIQSQISTVESREFQSLLHSLELHQRIWEQNHNTNKPQGLVVQYRVEGVNLAVGMIVRDKFWELAGVIHGWNLSLRTPKENQPKVYYNVLMEDGRYQCTPQENLHILHSPPFVSHPSIGRFFDEFCMTYYRPNKELQAQYPQDLDALQKILKKDRLN